MKLCIIVELDNGKRTLASKWNDRTPRTRIVAIGADPALDGEELRETFDRCVT